MLAVSHASSRSTLGSRQHRCQDQPPSTHKPRVLADKESLHEEAALAAVVSALAVPAAASAGDGYGSQPGFGHATENTACAGAGAFGAFGATGDVYHDFGINNDANANGAEPGTPGTLVGLNNSALCGNR
jgi:hypothetical protein